MRIASSAFIGIGLALSLCVPAIPTATAMPFAVQHGSLPTQSVLGAGIVDVACAGYRCRTHRGQRGGYGQGYSGHRSYGGSYRHGYTGHRYHGGGYGHRYYGHRYHGGGYYPGYGYGYALPGAILGFGLGYGAGYNYDGYGDEGYYGGYGNGHVEWCLALSLI